MTRRSRDGEVSAPEAASLLDVDPRTVRRYVEEGRFPGARKTISGRIWIPIHDLDRWLADRVEQRPDSFAPRPVSKEQDVQRRRSPESGQAEQRGQIGP